MEMAETQAVEAKINPTEETLWRSVERQYSKLFHTPLHLVCTLDPLYVLTSLYENKLEGLSVKDDEEFNQILDSLYRLQDPNYDSEREKEEEEYNKRAVLEEEERLAKIAAKKAKKTGTKPAIDSKHGGVNLSYLSELQDNEG